MSENDKMKFDRMLAFHSAPTLLGVKCANLFAVDQNDYRLCELENYFLTKKELCGAKIRFLCRCSRRVLAFVYHEQLLSMWLSERKTAEFLSEYGYAERTTIDEKLSLLESRLSCGSFPHEIGVFLGYPINDVRGFIENRGENYIFCGFYKVYSDPEKAKRTFQKYVECRDYLCDKVSHGVSLDCAMAKFKEEKAV